LIQAGLVEDWPPEVRQALASFKQGHLIARPPIFYAADLRRPVWSPTAALAEEGFAAGEERELIHLEQDWPPYGLIATQTCDIAEERPNPVQPWVQVCPVERCDPASPLLERDFVVRLDPPELDGEAWVADLRIEVPLEKSMLVGETPIEAFPNEAGYEELGSLLAQRRGRPALHSVFHEVINVTTRAMKQESQAMKKKARGVRDGIYRLKLDIADGTRLEPVAAKLYVVTRGESSQEAREWFADWWDRAREVALEGGLELLPTGWLNAEDLNMDLERYEELLDVRNPLHS